MDILQLRYFITVAAYGSIQDAADQLYVSRQAVSRSILALERELNENLFERTHNGIHLTCIGRNYVKPARALVEQFDQLMLNMNHNETIVDLVLCLPISLYSYFTKTIDAFKSKHSVVNLKIIHCTSAEADDYLDNHKADLVVSWTKNKDDCHPDDILFRSPTYFAVNENNHLAHKQRLDEADLKHTAKIFYTDGHDSDFFKDPFFVSKHEDYFVSDIMTVYDMVDRNLGIFPLPDIAIPLAKKGYRFIKHADPDKVTFFYCKTADHLKINPLKMKYCDCLRKLLKEKQC